MVGKVAVLGSADFVMPYTALGVDTFPAGDNVDDILSKAKQIVEGKYALVVVAENVAAKAEEVFALERNKPVPAIIIIPFTTESTGIATLELGNALRMATGIDILKTS